MNENGEQTYRVKTREFGEGSAFIGTMSRPTYSIDFATRFCASLRMHRPYAMGAACEYWVEVA